MLVDVTSTKEGSATARIAPLPAGEWSPAMTEFVARLRSSVVDDTKEAGQSAGMNIVGTLANHPALAMAFLTFNAQLLTENTLTDRQREMLILRVSHLRHSDYEWAQHALMAAGVGMSDQEIARVASGPEADGWADDERILLAAADELILDSTVSADTWAAFRKTFSEQQAIDLVFTVGSYAMLAMALRAFEVVPEDALRAYLPDSNR